MQNTSKGKLYSIVEQVTSNTTSWVGLPPGETTDISSGQTFVSPAAGELDSIEVFASLVIRSGNVNMTVHEFDAENKTWGASLVSSTVGFSQADNEKWVSFPLQGLKLQQGKSYGFLLESPACFIGVGEAVGTYGQPLPGNGQEWKFTSGNNKGTAYSYFSLAFKVDLKAA